MNSTLNQQSPIYVLLHNIRSAHNVGSIFRTADALAVSRIFITGYTPTPFDRFGRPVKEIAKTALGAELSIPWEYAKKPDRFLRSMKDIRVEIVGIEQDDRALNYKDYKEVNSEQGVLIVVGNEVRGMSKGLRGRCDTLVEIPMYGKKESLNVGVAFGVVLFRMFDR